MTPREALLARGLAWFAEHGVGDTSLRTLAAGIGTSHRMLIYHFGSREGLLGAVVEAVERGEQAKLAGLLDSYDDPVEAGQAFWSHVADAATTFGPLFFELASAAMRAEPYAASLRAWLATGWTEVLGGGFVRAGWPASAADELARLSVAVARGVLLELCVTGDRAAADVAMDRWTALVLADRPTPA